jgi:hypothetical protein
MTLLSIRYERHAQRRDTEANWAAANPVLADGEHGIVTDAGHPRPFKIGDGSTAWNSLVYATPFFAAASGTDTITATFDPTPVLFDGMEVKVRAAGANTGAATFNPNALGAAALTKQGGTALAAGDIAAAGHELILRYRSSVPRWELLNPATSVAVIADDAVTNAKLANMAAGTIKARKTASIGDPEDCTLTEVINANIASVVQGDILYYNGTSWTRLGPGTAGEFLKTNGAGANPAWAAGSGGGISSGTSFPGSPSNNDLYYRTDLDLLCFYDSGGSRWMTVNEYTLSGTQVSLGVHSVTAVDPTTFPVPSDYNIFVTRIALSMFVLTTNSATQYWTASFSQFNSAGAAIGGVLGSTKSTISAAANTYIRYDIDVNTALDANARIIYPTFTKVSTAGNLYPAYSVLYRKIIT